MYCNKSDILPLDIRQVTIYSTGIFQIYTLLTLANQTDAFNDFTTLS